MRRVSLDSFTLAANISGLSPGRVLASALMLGCVPRTEASGAPLGFIAGLERDSHSIVSSLLSGTELWSGSIADR